jgi:serine/threonine protein kinase
MYERLEQLGKGSFSTVYRGRRAFTGQMVALKVINTTKKTPEELASLRSEVAILRRLDHPNIVSLLDVLETPTELTVVTELAQGELLEVLLEDGALPDGVVRAVALQLTRALAYLHERGVVHRDLKPQNVLIASGGRVKLADFGFARDIPAFLMTSIKGTPLYMAPEMFAASKYSPAADVWGLGVLLFEMAKGAPPFYAADLAALMQKVVSEEVDVAAEPTFSAGLKGFLALCLVKEPARRAPWATLLQHPWLGEGVRE